MEAKCLPSDQIARRKNKRNSENGELQLNSAKSKSPAQKKSKQTVEKQPTAEHIAKVTKSLDKLPTPTLVNLSPTLPSDAASGWEGWALAHHEFGSSVNPITTRGADYAHHITASPPGFENPAASLH